jgi:hypothetical protein
MVPAGGVPVCLSDWHAWCPQAACLSVCLSDWPAWCPQAGYRTLQALPSLCLGFFLHTVVDWFVVVRPCLEVADLYITRPLMKVDLRGKRTQWLMFPIR